MNEKELAEQLLLTPKAIEALNDQIEASKEFQDLPDDQVTLYVGQKHCEVQLHKAFNNPITIEIKCPDCEGTGYIGGAAINDLCSDCKGTGKVDKTFTIKQCIEGEMSSGIFKK